MVGVISIAVLIGLVLGLFGSGGSILTVPALVYLLHLPVKTAIHMSLAIVSIISFMAALPYWWRRQVPWSLTLQLAIPGAFGAWVGSWCSQWLPAPWQLGILAVLMLLAAINMWRRQLVKLPLNSASAFLAVGFGIGLLTGLIGVGGGFLLVPVLVAVTDLAMRQVIGVSLTLVLLQSVSGFISHSWLQPETLSYSSIFWLGGLGALGSLAGLWLLPRLPQLVLRRAFSVFLLALGGFLISQSVLR